MRIPGTDHTMELIDSFIRKWLGYWFNIDVNLKNLKRKTEELSTRVDDVETELRVAEHRHPAKRPRKVVLHWCQNAQQMIDYVPRLEQEVDGLRRWKFVSRALLGKRVEEKMQEVAELQEQHNFPHGVLIDAPSTSEQFIPKRRFFRESDTITARNKQKYLMDNELSDGNHQHWQPLASGTNQYRQPPPLNTFEVVTTAARPCSTPPITMSKGSCHCLAHTTSKVLHKCTSSSDCTHTSTSQPSSWNPQSQPLLVAPSSSQATTSLPSSLSSSHPTSGMVTSNSALTRCGQGYARGIKEWNTGSRVDIQFDNTFQSVGDLAASMNGQLGHIVCSRHQVPLAYVNCNSTDYWSNSAEEGMVTQNFRNRGLRGPPHTMGQTHLSQIRHQDGYNGQLLKEPESLHDPMGSDGHGGYFGSYGGDVPRSAVYRHGVCPSHTSQTSMIAEFTQQFLEKFMQEQASMMVENAQQICEKLKRELRAELTTHIEQMTT